MKNKFVLSQTVLAAHSCAFGTDAGAIAQALVDLTRANYRHANGAFSAPSPTGPNQLGITVPINSTGRANALTYANGYGSGYDVGNCSP